MNKQFILLRGEGFRGVDMGQSYLYFLTQEPKNRGKIFANLKIVFCVYGAFTSCEYLVSNSNIDPVQRLSDPFMKTFAHAKIVINVVSR